MKRILFHTLTLAAITLCLSVISASAQGSYRYQSSVPFDFTVGDQTFKAGDYTLRVVDAASDRPILSISSVATGKSKLFITQPEFSDPNRGSAQLRFVRIGDEYFLADLAGPELSVRFHQTRRVKELAQASRVNAAEARIALTTKR